MKTVLLKSLALSAVGLVPVVASAESYVAKIYSVPPGGTSMDVLGAGDNGLMSGSLEVGVNQFQAVYRTNSGYKILHPAGWHMSQILDSWGGTYHCGSGRQTDGSSLRALFWIGGGTATNLHPAGAEYTFSVAQGGGGQLRRDTSAEPSPAAPAEPPTPPTPESGVAPRPALRGSMPPRTSMAPPTAPTACARSGMPFIARAFRSRRSCGTGQTASRSRSTLPAATVRRGLIRSGGASKRAM